MGHAFSAERKLAPAGLELHYLSSVWPRMEREKKHEFLEDIKKAGRVEVDIVLFEGKVLDGGHRYGAAQVAGVDCYYVEYIGDDPEGYVVSMNAMRRFATKQDIAVAAVKCFEHRTKRAGRPSAAESTAPAAPVDPPAPPADEPSDFEAAMDAPVGGEPAPEPSAEQPEPEAPAEELQPKNADIAAMTGSSISTISRARRIVRDGDPPKREPTGDEPRKSQKDLRIETLEKENAEKDTRIEQLESQVREYEQQSSPEEAARMAESNALREELRVAEGRLNEVRNQLNIKTRRVSQLEKMLKGAGVQLNTTSTEEAQGKD